MRNTIASLLLGGTIGLFGSAHVAAAESDTLHDAHAAAGQQNWLRVHGDAAQLRGLPVDSTGIDYGSFRWLPMTPSHVAHLREAGLEVHRYDRAFELDLGGMRFDPLNDRPPTARLASGWLAADEADWRLVQFRGPVQQAWLDALTSAGVEPVQYVYPHAYVVWADAQSFARSAELPGLRWHGEFLPEFRLAPVFRRSSPEVIAVQLLVRAGLTELDATLTALGAPVLDRGRMDRHLDVLELHIEGSRLAELAALPGVYSVQPIPTDGGTRSEMSVQINTGNVDAGGAAFPGYANYLAQIGLTGDGVIMACVDNGIQTNHPDLASRILPCTGPSCGTGTQTSDGHGTHVAGIMAGDASSGVTNTGGFLRGQGMAPGARLINQRNSSVGNPWILNLMRESVRNNAVLSNNSWGPSGSALGYNGHTREADVGVRDADADAAGDQPLLYVLAIMNGSGGTSSQGTPDEAKNVFTIGSAWAQTSADTQNMNNANISSNSGHGPALDGRFIPHMIANSRFTDSTLGASGYGLQGGTSQAAPHVAGASGLFFEYYRTQFDTDPSPALVKAAFLPVTQDLVGNLDANNNPIGARPERKQGWGRMRTTPVLAPEQSVLYFDQEHVFSGTGQVWEATFTADDPDQAMRLMLVWTDAPGHGLGGSTPAWNNNLDLRVQVGEDLYLGNVFNNGWSATGGMADHRNNSEGVFLQPAQHQGSISVQVLAADINSNALPNAGASNSQDFALVCYNCVDGDMPAPESDLSVNLLATPDPVLAGESLSYMITVANLGPHSTGWSQIRLQLPAEVEYLGINALNSPWDCAHDSGLLTCDLTAPLQPGARPTRLQVNTEVALLASGGTIGANVEIAGKWDDPDSSNNTAQINVEVIDITEVIFRNGFE